MKSTKTTAKSGAHFVFWLLIVATFLVQRSVSTRSMRCTVEVLSNSDESKKGDELGGVDTLMSNDLNAIPRDRSSWLCFEKKH